MIDPDIRQQYNNIDWHKLLRTDLGEYSLEEAKPQFDKIKRLFDYILNYPNIENLSTSFTNSVQTSLEQFLQFTNRVMQEFRDTGHKESWLSQIREEEFSIFQTLFPAYSYLHAFDPAKDKELDGIVRTAKERSEEINTTLSKAEQILSTAQQHAIKSEVLKYGDFFGTEANKNKKNAKINFWVMIGCIVATVVLGFFFSRNINPITTEGAGFWANLLATNAQNIIFRFILLSIMGYVISHFSKVYSAEKHLYNVNIQRQNALNSHQQILDSVITTENEKDIRNAVLLELTKAIFESKDTGYIKKNEKNSINIFPNLKV